MSLELQISATFTAEPLRQPLEFWLRQLGLEMEVGFTGYQQVLQEALDPGSRIGRNAGGFNLFLIRLEDLAGDAVLPTVAAELGDAIAALAARSSATQLVVFCPDRQRNFEVEGLERDLADRWKNRGNIEAVLSNVWTSLYPVPEPYDPEMEQVGRIPYTVEMFAALATLAVRRMSARLRPPAKVIVLDADNTLWGGVCGEDGAAGLNLGGPWRFLREFMAEKRREGFLIALSSKNHVGDVDRVFAEREAELGLSRSDFSGWKVNWNPKSQNLRELAANLNLGLDSVVFIDDNPAEVAEVAANCPGVLALVLPESAEEIPNFLNHLWPLDGVGRTEEDGARAEFYRQESDRRALREAAPTYGEFLRGLELRVEIEEATEVELPRLSQLTKRTNQFNVNPLRLSEGDLARRLEGAATCLAVRVADRFGDYGLVGAVLYHGEDSGKRLPVEVFLLSCRAMGKGVERAMVIALGERAAQLGAEEIEFACTQTERNEPCRRFLEGIGAHRDTPAGRLRLSAKAAAALSPLPEEPEPVPTMANATTEGPKQSAVPIFDANLARQIATDWSCPAELHRMLSAERRPRPELAQALVKPGRPDEIRLAEMWQEILGVAEVGVDDPFSALGGSSIQLVRLHAMIRREFGTELAIAELFELPTIAKLSQRLSAEKATPNSVEKEGMPSIATSPNPDDQAVAIVGLALRVPGANDPDTFWSNLTSGVESIARFSKDEIEYPEEFDKPGYVPAKGIIEGTDLFDAAFFGVLPKDARIMDPQQRIFLELAWEAMERAGYTPENHRCRIGVYAGAYFDTYLLANLCTDRAFLANLIPSIQVGSLQTELGNDKDYLATRVAFKMNLRGPAMTLQTACSTSMVAIIEACRAIRSGLCDMALAGGVTLTLPLKRGYFYTEQGMLSGDGHCRAFDEKASGTVFGNGAGVVMLKRLSDAIRDRDHIHAVIRGTGMNNDGGVKHSYTAPSVEGQVDVIRMAQRDAGVEANSIGYIEAHGTGTPLGDPIEVTALTKAFQGAGVAENQYCAIGSLKTNIGHLDVASGVCGVIKTALSLENEALPPTLHFKKANPKIDFEKSPFFVNAALTPWTEGRNGQPRRAGVSSFGVGGTNAHVIVEEAPAVESGESFRRNQLFLISARTDEAANAAVDNLARFAASPGATRPADAAWTLAIGRKPFRMRRAIVVEDFGQLKDSLATGGGVTGVAERSNPPVQFLFPGQGAQHVNMGRAFYKSEPRFRRIVDQCSEILRPHLGLSLTDVLYPGENADLEAAADQLKHTVLAQPAIFVIEYALADLWMHWGIRPVAMIGHSVGEFVAACHAGVFDLEDGLKLLAARGRLMGDLPGGGMLSVRLPEADLIERLPATLDLAAVNGPSLCVVAGPRDELDAFRQELEAGGVVSQPLHTSHAFHSRMMDPVIDRFAAEFDGIELRAPGIPILSTVTGEWLTEKETADPQYWAQHLRNPVRFHKAVATLAAERPEQIFIEVGPGQTLTGLARQSFDRKAGHLAVSSCRHVKEPGCDHANLLESVGKLWASGVEFDWEAFYGEEIRKRVVLPTYPFERKRHWVDPKPISATEAEIPPPISQESRQSAPLLAPDPIPFPTVMSTPAIASRLEPIANAIRDVLTDLSGIPAEELAGEASFLELGFDSLLLTQVSKALAGEFGTEITLRQLMGDFSSIDAMVAHLDATLPSDRYRDPVAAVPAPAPVVTSPAAASPAPIAASAVVTSLAAPMALPLTTPMAVAPVPVTGGGFLEGVVAQQLDLMRQQIALLQGAPTMAAQALPAAPAPVATLAVPAPVATPAPAPAKPAAPANAAPSSDVSAPTTSINRSLDDELTDSQRRHLEELIANYTGKTRTSKELTAKYRQWHADPRTVSGFNRRWKEMIYQIAVTNSKGSRLMDVDGNEYIDLLNGFGPNFLGHSPDFVTEALHAQLDRGIEVGPQCVNAMEAAQLFCEITGNERASFVNTGSEAVQAAMRLARTVTGRDKIVVFTKDYHGNFDEVLVKGVGSGDQLRSLPIAPGIPRRAVEDVIVLPYGTDEALEVIRSRAHELAAVIIEPIQSRRPEFQPREFIHAVRDITRESGTVFVFDEVITGFRTGPRGAQEYYGVEADIATYGKVVGGGLPLGVVAGKAEYMDTFDGGMWQYGDDSFPEKGVTFFAGTFVRHPLAMAAVKQVLLHLREQGPEFWQGIRERANRLAGTVDRLFVENEIPIRMPNFGSQMFIRVAEDHKYANLLFFHLRNKGVFLLEGFPTYMTGAHTDEDIDYVISAFRESIAEMQEAGFFERPANGQAIHLNGSRLSGPPRLLSSEESESSKKKATAGTSSRPFPMTEPLAEVWLASQLGDQASLCFNEVNVFSLRGELDVPALRSALGDLTMRHEALRSVFPADGEGFEILPRVEVPLVEVDLEASDAAEVADALTEQGRIEQETLFDLETGPLFRGRLIHQGDGEHTLILNAHHLVADGWSYNVLIRDMAECYRARLEGRNPGTGLAPQFGSYAIEAVKHEAALSGSASEAYWAGRFAEPVHALSLSTDFPAPAETDFSAGTVAVEVDPETVTALKKVAGRSGATLFGLLLGTYQILLHRLSRQSRFVVGFPAAGQGFVGKEDLVGHCVNFLPFVAEIDRKTSFGPFLRKTQSDLLDAQDHQDCTYGRLIKQSGALRLPGERPQTEAAFNFEKMEDTMDLPGLKVTVRELERRFVNYPIFLKTCESRNGLELRFDFQSALFDPATIREWLDTYRAMLQAIVADAEVPVERVAAVISDRQRGLLEEWNRTEVEYPRDKTVSQLFEEIVESSGADLAIRVDGAGLSYGQLGELTDRIAHSLSDSGVGPGDRVALFMDRSFDLVASMLAVMKLGAIYVPVDPNYPVERIQHLMNDSDAKLILGEKSLLDRLSGDGVKLAVDQAVKRGKAGKAPRNRAIDPDTAACLLYTSGSTGQPKGAMITHRSIVRLGCHTNFTRHGKGEVVLQAGTFCFDPSLYEIFGPLMNGGVTVLPPAGPLTIDTIAKCIREEGVTQLFLTAGLFQVMVDETLEAFAGLRRVITGGDVASPRHAARFLEAHPDCVLVNGYGPTENTTFTTCHEITGGDLIGRAIPIGRPLNNTTVWILDEDGNPVPPGIPGELYTGGDGVALGYHGKPELTAERFLPDPFRPKPGGRMYRTGDLCRYRADGLIDFLGRIDHQVKIRGFRIEIGEIESQLGRHPGVKQCKVVVQGSGAADKSLVAYVAPVPMAAPTTAELADYLRSKMPGYMVPAAFVMLEALPINPNGKVDAKALPLLANLKAASEAEVENLPSTATEEAVTALWKDILGVKSVGLDDDFFALGGHSLMGMKLFSRIQRTLGVTLPLGRLFRAPTIRQLARAIDEEKEEGISPETGQTPAVSEMAEPSVHRGGIHLIEDDEIPKETAPSESFVAAPTTVAIQPKGDELPIFAVHGGDGGILFYGNLASRLGEERPFYAFEAPALTAEGPVPEESVETTAARYLSEMRKVRPEGPYILCGYSFGGVVAYEMACQLVRQGGEVALLGLFDTENPAAEARRLSMSERVAANWNDRSRANAGVIEKVGALGKRVGSGLAYRLFFEAEYAVAKALPPAKGSGWLKQVQLRQAHERAMEAYLPPKYPGKLTLFRAIMGHDKFDVGYEYGWDSVVQGGIDVIDIPGNHVSVFHKENIDGVSEAFRKALSGVES